MTTDDSPEIVDAYGLPALVVDVRSSPQAPTAFAFSFGNGLLPTTTFQ
jgi:hypothetical protein